MSHFVVGPAGTFIKKCFPNWWLVRLRLRIAWRVLFDRRGVTIINQNVFSRFSPEVPFVQFNGPGDKLVVLIDSIVTYEEKKP